MRALLAAVLLAASAASAAEYVDTDTGLRVPLDVPGAQVCVFFPRELRDAAACEGLDVAAVDARPAPKAGLVAMVRHEDFFTTLAAAVLQRPSSAPFDAKGMAEYVEGSRRALTERGGTVRTFGLASAGAPFDELDLDGRRVLRFATEHAPRGDSGLDHTLTYVLAGDDSLTTVSLSVAGAHLAQVAAEADALVRGVKVPPADPARTAAMRSGGMEAAGYHFGRAVFFLGLALAMVAVPVVLVALLVRSRLRARRRRQAAEAAAAPPQP